MDRTLPIKTQIHVSLKVNEFSGLSYKNIQGVSDLNPLSLVITGLARNTFSYCSDVSSNRELQIKNQLDMT